MLKTLRWMSLASLLLLCTAGGAYYVGEHKAKIQLAQISATATDDQALSSGLVPDTNRWHVVALISLTAGLAVGIAALMVWRQEHSSGMASISLEG